MKTSNSIFFRINSLFLTFVYCFSLIPSILHHYVHHDHDHDHDHDHSQEYFCCENISNSSDISLDCSNDHLEVIEENCFLCDYYTFDYLLKINTDFNKYIKLTDFNNNYYNSFNSLLVANSKNKSPPNII